MTTASNPHSLTLFVWNVTDSVEQLAKEASEGDQESEAVLESLIQWSKRLHRKRVGWKAEMSDEERLRQVHSTIRSLCDDDTPPEPRRKVRR